MDPMDRRRESLIAEVAALPGTLVVPHHPGDLIFQDGAFAAGVYLVAEGLVTVGGYAPGTPRPVALAGRGDLLGLEAWRSEPAPRYQGFARALTAATLLFATADAWSRALDRPPFRELVLSALVELVLDRRPLALYRDRPELALAWTLIRWGEKTDGEGQVRLSIPAATLASILGVSRNAVRQAVARLSDLDAAQQVNGHIVGAIRRLHGLLEESATASAR
jgi:CRP-like cAMP-binding protein